MHDGCMQDVFCDPGNERQAVTKGMGLGPGTEAPGGRTLVPQSCGGSAGLQQDGAGRRTDGMQRRSEDCEAMICLRRTAALKAGRHRLFCRTQKAGAAQHLQRQDSRPFGPRNHGA